MHILKRDNVEVFRGSEDQCFEWVHNHHSFSFAWACRHEGYSLEPVIEPHMLVRWHNFQLHDQPGLYRVNELVRGTHGELFIEKREGNSWVPFRTMSLGELSVGMAPAFELLGDYGDQVGVEHVGWYLTVGEAIAATDGSKQYWITYDGDEYWTNRSPEPEYDSWGEEQYADDYADHASERDMAAN